MSQLLPCMWTQVKESTYLEPSGCPTHFANGPWNKICNPRKFKRLAIGQVSLIYNHTFASPGKTWSLKILDLKNPFVPSSFAPCQPAVSLDFPLFLFIFLGCVWSTALFILDFFRLLLDLLRCFWFSWLAESFLDFHPCFICMILLLLRFKFCFQFLLLLLRLVGFASFRRLPFYLSFLLSLLWTCHIKCAANLWCCLQWPCMHNMIINVQIYVQMMCMSMRYHAVCRNCDYYSYPMIFMGLESSAKHAVPSIPFARPDYCATALLPLAPLARRPMEACLPMKSRPTPCRSGWTKTPKLSWGETVGYHSSRCQNPLGADHADWCNLKRGNCSLSKHQLVTWQQALRKNTTCKKSWIELGLQSTMTNILCQPFLSIYMLWKNTPTAHCTDSM